MNSEFWYPSLVLCLAVGVLGVIAKVAESGFAAARNRRLVWVACVAGMATATVLWLLGVPFLVHDFLGSTGLVISPDVPTADMADLQFSTEKSGFKTHIAEDQWPSTQWPRQLQKGVRVNSLREVAGDVADPVSSFPTFAWVTPVFLCVWLLGIALGLGWIGLQRWSIRKLLRTAEPISNTSFQRWVTAQAKRLGFARRLRLISCSGLQTPVAFGVIRPTIATPKSFPIEPLDVRSQAIFLHELSHLAGGDPFWNSLAALIKTFLWWHPMAWMTAKRLKELCEEAADEATVLLPNGPRELAAGLLECARGRFQTRMPVLAALRTSRARSCIAQRIHRLLALEKKGDQTARVGKTKRIQRLVVVTMAIAVFVASLGFPVPEVLLTKGEVAMRHRHSLWRHSLMAAAIAAFAAPWGVQTLAAEGPRPDQPREVVREERPDAPREREAVERERGPREGGEVRHPEEERRERGEARGPRDEGRGPRGPEAIAGRLEELRGALREAEEARQMDRAEQIRREIRSLEAELERAKEVRRPEGPPPEVRAAMMERIERAMNETREKLREAREAGREEAVRDLERRLEQLERAMRDLREGRRPELPPGLGVEPPPVVAREQARERLERAMNEVRERLQKAREEGREGEVRELEQQLARMERQMAALREGRPPLPPGGPVPERLERARRAAELLRREGFGDMAELLMRSLEREMRPLPPREPGRVGPPDMPPPPPVRRPDRPESPDRPPER